MCNDVYLLQLLPEVQHGWLIQEVAPDIVQTARECGFEMVCPRANALTAEGVQALKAAGFVVRAWGVKSIEVSAEDAAGDSPAMVSQLVLCVVSKLLSVNS